MRHPSDAADEQVSAYPVPPQRSGHDDPGADLPPDALDDRGTFDDPSVPGEVAKPFFGTPEEEHAAAAANRPDSTPPDVEFTFHEPPPQPTAFGAATVGGAVAASALAGQEDRDDADDRRSDVDRRTDAASGVADDRIADPDQHDRHSDSLDAGPGLRHDPTDHGHGQESAHQGSADHDVTGTQPGHDSDRQAEDDRLDRHTGDDERRGGHAEPAAAQAPAAGRPWSDAPPGFRQPEQPEQPAGSTGPHDEAGDSGYAPEFVAVPAGAGNSADPATSGAAGGPGRPTPDAATVGASAPLGSVTTAAEAPLFADSEAHGLRDRWRDVQLRFVDDPRAAAGDARHLLDEAVDALSRSLRTRTGELGSADTDDTEQLRILIRRYRDFLDRVLGL